MNLRTLYLEHWSLGEADIHAIASLKRLELLDLCGCDVDPRLLEYLRPLHDLRGLGIPILEIDGEMISVLQSFQNLEDVWLDDADRAYIIRIPPKENIPLAPIIATLRDALPRVKLHTERPVYAGLRGDAGQQVWLDNMDP